MLMSMAWAIHTYQTYCTLLKVGDGHPFEVAFIPGGFMDAVAFEFGKEFLGVRKRPWALAPDIQKFP